VFVISSRFIPLFGKNKLYTTTIILGNIWTLHNLLYREHFCCSYESHFRWPTQHDTFAFHHLQRCLVNIFKHNINQPLKKILHYYDHSMVQSKDGKIFSTLHCTSRTVGCERIGICLSLLMGTTCVSRYGSLKKILQLEIVRNNFTQTKLWLSR
jgi:hypothetical protein